MKLNDVRVKDSERYGGMGISPEKTSKPKDEKRGPTIYMDGCYCKNLGLPDDLKGGDFIRIEAVCKVKRVSSSSTSSDKSGEKTEESMELEILRMGVEPAADDADTKAAGWNDTDGEDGAAEKDDD